MVKLLSPKTNKMRSRVHSKQVQWYALIIPDIQEAEAGRSLEPRSSETAWATYKGQSLSQESRAVLKKKKKSITNSEKYY
jgi:hypothetical protein